MEKTVFGNYSIQYNSEFIFFVDKNSKNEHLKNFTEKVREKLKSTKGQFVYVYFFMENSINITVMDNVVYIGRSKSFKQKTFERFMHEIYEDNSGNDKAKQYTLTHFYNKGIKMRLEVYFVDDCRKIEKELLRAHKEVFGYLPIANRKEG